MLQRESLKHYYTSQILDELLMFDYSVSIFERVVNGLYSPHMLPSLLIKSTYIPMCMVNYFIVGYHAARKF